MAAKKKGVRALGVRLTSEERAGLEKMAKAKGVTISFVARQLVRAALGLETYA